MSSRRDLSTESQPMAPPAVGDVNSNTSLAMPIIPLAKTVIKREVETN
jgi:hypothetical protein